MKRSLFAFPLLASVAISLAAGASAKDWYVTGTGNDTNDGSSVAKAFRNLSKASGVVKPGDVVNIGNGNYTSNSYTVLEINKSGTANAYITWKAIPGQNPQIHSTQWNGIVVLASYIIIDGLTLIGNNDSITLADALADEQKSSANPHFNTNGISINGGNNAANAKPHHIIIRHCTVAKHAGGGLGAGQVDYITFEDNIVYENAWYSRYGNSGISTGDNWRYDDAPGYHNIIQRNYVHDNKGLVPWKQIGRQSDGNGIILDVTNHDSKSPIPEWKGRTLVANNVSFRNGGSGIHVYNSQHADIVNNTLYQNGQVVGYPDLFSNAGSDVAFLNNVIVPRSDGQLTNDANNKGSIRWDYNLYPVSQNFIKGAHDIVADPKFVDAGGGNFHLASGSPALSSGTTELAQATDLTGKARASGKAPDRGAYQDSNGSNDTNTSSNSSGNNSGTDDSSQNSDDALVLDAKTGLYKNGSYSTENLEFTDEGTYSIIVSAKGTVCQGGWPIMKVNVGSDYASTQTVSSTSFKNYTFNATIKPGIKPVTVSFTNDCYFKKSDGTYEDRNLLLDKITIE